MSMLVGLPIHYQIGNTAVQTLDPAPLPHGEVLRVRFPKLNSSAYIHSDILVSLAECIHENCEFGLTNYHSVTEIDFWNTFNTVEGTNYTRAQLKRAMKVLIEKQEYYLPDAPNRIDHCKSGKYCAYSGLNLKQPKPRVVPRATVRAVERARARANPPPSFQPGAYYPPGFFTTPRGPPTTFQPAPGAYHLPETYAPPVESSPLLEFDPNYPGYSAWAHRPLPTPPIGLNPFNPATQQEYLAWLHATYPSVPQPAAVPSPAPSSVPSQVYSIFHPSSYTMVPVSPEKPVRTAARPILTPLPGPMPAPRNVLSWLPPKPVEVLGTSSVLPAYPVKAPSVLPASSSEGQSSPLEPMIPSNLPASTMEPSTERARFAPMEPMTPPSLPTETVQFDPISLDQSMPVVELVDAYKLPSERRPLAYVPPPAPTFKSRGLKRAAPRPRAQIDPKPTYEPIVKPPTPSVPLDTYEVGKHTLVTPLEYGNNANPNPTGIAYNFPHTYFPGRKGKYVEEWSVEAGEYVRRDWDPALDEVSDSDSEEWTDNDPLCPVIQLIESENPYEMPMLANGLPLFQSAIVGVPIPPMGRLHQL